MSAAFTGDPLDLFRSLYCLTLAVILLGRLRADSAFMRLQPEMRPLPRLLGRWALPRLAAGPWLASVLMLVALLVAVGLGLPSAVALVAASALSLLHFAQLAGAPTVHRKANTIPVLLALFAASMVPGTADPATVSSAVRTTAKLLIAQIYFSAGLCKLRASGWRWADGVSLQRWLAYYHLRDGSALTLKLAASRGLCRLAAGLALGFELTFWLVIPFPVLEWVYLPAALCFHVATAWLLRINYWIYLGPAYLVFAAEAIAAAH